MEVLIPSNPNFNYAECKKLFEDNQNLLEDFYSFDEVITNTFFYSFRTATQVDKGTANGFELQVSNDKCRNRLKENLQAECIEKDGVHIGCIYFYEIDGNLYVNAVAYRKTHLLNIECFKKSLTWWNCDIYARTHHKTAIYGILKCGFKKIKPNLYVYKRK